MKVGFIGLGIMGSSMAKNLMDAGFDLVVYDMVTSKCEPLAAKGAKAARSCAEVARLSDVIISIVLDTPDVEAVLFGTGGVEEGLSPGKVVVDMTTISPEATESFAERLAEKGVDMLDAPVSGGDKGAREATLAIMVGGKKEVFEHCLPLFKAMGKNIVHVGSHGDGQRVKTANQIVCGLNILAMTEAFVFARKAGLDLETVHKVISSGAAASWMLTNLGPKILDDDYSPGFKIKLQSKDLRIAWESLQALGIPLEGTQLTNKLFREATEKDFGELGTQGLIKLFDA